MMKKILIIDDDPAIVQILMDCLAEDGYAVLVASDAYTGMDAALREHPDLITLDFQMPAGDGGRVHERLRGNVNTAKIPIIFVTGVELTTLPPFARGDNTTRFIPKPIDMGLLRTVVAELLGVPLEKPAAPPAPPEHPLDGGALGGDILKIDL